MEDKPNSEDHFSDKQQQVFCQIFNKVTKCSSRTQEWTTQVMQAILTRNESLLKSLSEQGLPDDMQQLRALVWKINLKYLSLNYDDWDNELKKKREEYQSYKESITQILEQEFKEKTYRNREVLGIITKDINRTYLHFAFFLQPISKSIKMTQEQMDTLLKKRQDCDISKVEDVYRLNTIETHADVLGRILFIYSFFNPDLSYNQGMNEILAPIYYCFAYDRLFLDESVEEIEADAFWTFVNIMKDIRSSFDHNHPKNTFFKADLLEKMLAIVDKELFDALADNGIKFEYFAYKWFILLFSQEFQFLDVLKLWDMMFSQDNKFVYVFYIALAYLKYRKEEIVNGDMASIMLLFQETQTVDVDELIPSAKDIKKVYSSKLEHLFKQLDEE